MIRLKLHGLRTIRRLALVGLLALGLVATTAIAALAQASGTWTTTGSMNTARTRYTATLLPTGKVLVAGGLNQTNLLGKCRAI